MVTQSNLLTSGILSLDDFFFFHFFLNMLFFISFLFLQLEIEVLKLFDATISNFWLFVKEVRDMISLSSYI
jgi:dolichol kinase